MVWGEGREGVLNNLSYLLPLLPSLHLSFFTFLNPLPSPNVLSFNMSFLLVFILPSQPPSSVLSLLDSFTFHPYHFFNFLHLSFFLSSPQVLPLPLLPSHSTFLHPFHLPPPATFKVHTARFCHFVIISLTNTYLSINHG